MARRPTPTHLKLVTGNPGKRKLNKAEPRPHVSSKPVPPPTLSLAAQRAWARVYRLLDGMGVLTALDALALERLCETYAEVEQAQALLRDRGSPTYETQTIQGGRMVRAFPEVAMLADADRRLKNYLVEFGLTPAARSKVGASVGNGSPDALDNYFS